MCNEFKLAIFFLIVAIALTAVQCAYANERVYIYRQNEYSFYQESEYVYVMEIKSGIRGSEAYKKLPELLSKLTILDTLRVDTSTPGGNTEGLNYIVNAIKTSDHKEFVVNVVGPTESAGAYLACEADKITMVKGTFLMWHSIRLGPLPDMYMTASELQFRANETRLTTYCLLKPCVDKGIIDKNTADRIISDHVQLYKLWDGTYFENTNNPGQ